MEGKEENGRFWKESVHRRSVGPPREIRYEETYRAFSRGWMVRTELIPMCRCRDQKDNTENDKSTHAILRLSPVNLAECENVVHN